MILKKFIIFIASIFIFLSQAQAVTVDKTDPYKMVHQVADNTFERIKKDKSVIEKDKEHLKVVVEEELIPYVDYKYASYRVLSGYIQQVREMKDPAQKKQAIANIKRFIEVFKNYLVTTYAGVFTQYKGQKVEFPASNGTPNKGVAMVKTRIVEQGKPDINISFKVREGKNKQWRAYDMVAEGVSLLDAKQSELQGVLRKEGIEYVIDLLDKKSKLPVQFRGKDGNK